VGVLIIADFQLPISNWKSIGAVSLRSKVWQEERNNQASSNRQLKIGIRQ
jgi:hypothetical protein